MTKNDIIRMARESGWDANHAEFDTRIERFAILVASKVCESCAEIVEVEALTYAEPTWALRIVNRIRARSNQ